MFTKLTDAFRALGLRSVPVAYLCPEGLKRTIAELQGYGEAVPDEVSAYAASLPPEPEEDPLPVAPAFAQPLQRGQRVPR